MDDKLAGQPGAWVLSRAIQATRPFAVWMLRAVIAIICMSFGVAATVDAQLTMKSSTVMIYGSVGIALGASLFAVCAHEAWRRGSWAWAPFLLILSIIMMVMSMTVSLGGVATVKDALRAANEAAQVNAELDRNRRKEVGDEIDAKRRITGGDTPDMVKTAIAKMEAGALYAISEGCKIRTKGAVTRHCDKLDEARIKLSAAERIVELEKKRDGWATLVSATPGAADPQIENMTTMAQDLGVAVAPQSLRAGLNAAWVIALELLGTFGPLAAFAYGRQDRSTRPARQDRQDTQAQDTRPGPVLITCPDDIRTPEKALAGIEFSPVLPTQDTCPATPEPEPVQKQDPLPVQKAIRTPKKAAKPEPVPAAPPALGDVAQWAEDTLDHQDGCNQGATPLHDNYKDWCAARGKHPVNQYAFGLTMKELKYSKEKVGGKMVYLNVGLKKGPRLKVVES